jgi:HemK-related putative methylase
LGFADKSFAVRFINGRGSHRDMHPIYEPREDSFLLLRNIATYARGTVLDMGSGSGVLAKEAMKTSVKVYAVDINPNAVKHLKKTLTSAKVLKSDLFSRLGRRRFDLILFNPPYLPSERKAPDLALDGGKHGYELIGRFMEGIAEHLTTEGKVLLLFSSYTNKEKIDGFVWKNCMMSTLIDSMKLDFEVLFVYLIEKTSLLKKLERAGVEDILFLAKGHRGIVFKGRYHGRDVAIKAVNPESRAINTIQHEAMMLERVNALGIGPRLRTADEDYLVMGLIDGDFIIPFIKRSKKPAIIAVINEVFKQLHALDKAGIEKAEMTRPVKHIIIGKRPVLIDFERARMKERPHNVTQFCQFLIRLMPILKEKGISLDKDKIIMAAKDYDQTRDLKKVLL